MRPVTDSFLNTVRGPHKAVFRARLVSPWQVGVNPAGAGQPMGINSGDVTFDVNSDVNGTLDITFAWGFSGIDPYSHELFVERGVQYANGVQEFVGLGYFRVNSVEQTSIPDSETYGSIIRVQGEDRMSNLRDARVISPIQFGAAASVSSVLDFLVQDVMPGVPTVYDTVNWPGGAAATTLLGSDHVVDQDRLQFIQQLVTAYGKVCYFDYAGRFVVKDTPNPNADPVFLINAGDHGVLIEASRSISRDGVYNGVVATGEPAGENPPVYGVALDSDPLSPTLWGGPFGKVPMFFTSSFLTTAGQCSNAALSILNSIHGLPYTVSLGMVPNPALEPWDVIQLRYDEDNQESHIIDTITYPLSVDDEMQIGTRKQYLT